MNLRMHKIKKNIKYIYVYGEEGRQLLSVVDDLNKIRGKCIYLYLGLTLT